MVSSTRDVFPASRSTPGRRTARARRCLHEPGHAQSPAGTPRTSRASGPGSPPLSRPPWSPGSCTREAALGIVHGAILACGPRGGSGLGVHTRGRLSDDRGSRVPPSAVPPEPLPPPPAASSETTRRLLSTTRRTGTANELALRAALDVLGVDYEVDAPAAQPAAASGRPGPPAGPDRGLLRRLLLAPLPEALPPAEGQRRVVGAEAAGRAAPRPRHRLPAPGRRLAAAAVLGARRPGDRRTGSPVRRSGGLRGLDLAGCP